MSRVITPSPSPRLISTLSGSVSAELQSEQARLSDQLRSFHETRLVHTLLEQLAVRPGSADSSGDDQVTSRR